MAVEDAVLSGLVLHVTKVRKVSNVEGGPITGNTRLSERTTGQRNEQIHIHCIGRGA